MDPNIFYNLLTLVEFFHLLATCTGFYRKSLICRFTWFSLAAILTLERRRNSEHRRPALSFVNRINPNNVLLIALRTTLSECLSCLRRLQLSETHESAARTVESDRRASSRTFFVFLTAPSTIFNARQAARVLLSSPVPRSLTGLRPGCEANSRDLLL